MNQFKSRCANILALQATRLFCVVSVVVALSLGLTTINSTFNLYIYIYLVASLAVVTSTLMTLKKGVDFELRRLCLRVGWVAVSILMLFTVSVIDYFNDIAIIPLLFGALSICFTMVSLLYVINNISDGFVRGVINSINNEVLDEIFRFSVTDYSTARNIITTVEKRNAHAMVFLMGVNCLVSTKISVYSNVCYILKRDTYFESVKKWLYIFFRCIITNGHDESSQLISCEQILAGIADVMGSDVDHELSKTVHAVYEKQSHKIIRSTF